MRYKLIKLILIALCLSQACTAHALSIIRDDEAENVIREIIAPILYSAQIDPARIEIYIINSNDVNAFTAGGHTIFIYQGLIKLSDNPDILAGIIAHEVGHITLGHVAREDDKINDALNPIRSISLGILSGIAAVLAKNPALLSVPLASAGHDYLHYTRIQESSADNMAVQIMRKADLSLDGLIEAMSYFKDKEKIMLGNTRYDYNRTHPFSGDRLEFMQREKNRYVSTNIIGTEDQRRRFSVVADKFRAYTEPANNVIEYFSKKNTFNARYAMAIALMRNNEPEQAENIINQLIADNTDNPYLLELRSTILYSEGRYDRAINDLEQACKIMGPGMSAIKLRLIHRKLDTDTDKQYINNVIGELEYEVMRSPHNLAVRYILANAYSADNQNGMSHITLGHLYVLTGDFTQAQRHLGIARGYETAEPYIHTHLKTLENTIETNIKKSSKLL